MFDKCFCKHCVMCNRASAFFSLFSAPQVKDAVWRNDGVNCLVCLLNCYHGKNLTTFFVCLVFCCISLIMIFKKIPVLCFCLEMKTTKTVVPFCRYCLLCDCFLNLCMQRTVLYIFNEVEAEKLILDARK